MTIYDLDNQRLVVRVVYDGPAYAGKTTNLASLCSLFSVRRRSEMFTAQTTGERTLYLDWLEIQGGVVAGHNVACQFLTVPGQAVLLRRRQFVLDMADVLVFVLNSTPRGMEEARNMLKRAKVVAAQRDLTLFVQANKQDLPGALSVEGVAEQAGVPSEFVIPAQSATGVGVRDTAVRAIRAAADRARAMIEKEGLERLTGEVFTGEQLVRMMVEFERSQPMSPVSILLDSRQRSSTPPALEPPARPDTRAQAAEEASDVDRPRRVETLEAPAPSEPPEEETDLAPSAPPPVPDEVEEEPVPSSLPVASREAEAPEAQPALPSEAPVQLRSEHGSLRARADEAAASDSRVADAVRRAVQSVAPPSSVRPVSSIPSRPKLRSIIPSARPSAPVELEEESEFAPPLPSLEVPTGCIWPSSRGRDVLRRVPLEEARVVDRAEHDGPEDAFVFEAGMWRLQTSTFSCYGNLFDARQALLVLARRKIALGRLLARNTVITLREDNQGRYWLWTISPWLASIAQLLDHAHIRGDESTLGENMIAYADSALRILELAHERSLTLSLHARSFGRLGRQTFYIGDADPGEADVPGFGESVIAQVDALEDHVDIVRAFVEHLERQLTGSLERDAVSPMALQETLRRANPTSDPGREAREQLLRAVAGSHAEREEN